MVTPTCPMVSKVDTTIEGDAHREAVGGLWKEIGKLQFEFMLDRGLKAHNTLIDVGCGSLRGGCKFIPYLEANKYFATDSNAKLIKAGIEKELSDQDRAKISEDSFIVSEDFNFNFKRVVNFDFGISFSLFTHLSRPEIVKCLTNLRQKFGHGRFYATFFVNETGKRAGAGGIEQTMGIRTFPDRDPFHYTVDEISEMACVSGWGMNYMGDFNHPRNQKMVEFSCGAKHE